MELMVLMRTCGLRRSHFLLEKRIRYRHEIIRDAIGPHPAKQEETTIGADDIALLKAAIIHRHVGRDPLHLDGRRRFFLDPAAVVFGARAKPRLQGREKQKKNNPVHVNEAHRCKPRRNDNFLLTSYQLCRAPVNEKRPPRGGLFQYPIKRWSDLCDAKACACFAPIRHEADATETQNHHGPSSGFRHCADRSVSERKLKVRRNCLTVGVEQL
jgi:hypothetical protein